MSKNAKSLVLEGVCVPSRAGHIKKEIGVSCKKKKQNLYWCGNYLKMFCWWFFNRKITQTEL